jgi:hypothetical protein
MQVTVNIPDELAAKAIADGSTPESYVEKLIAANTVSRETGIIRPRKQTREEFNASLDRLAQFSDKIPNLPIEAFSRASFYEDHD